MLIHSSGHPFDCDVYDYELREKNKLTGQMLNKYRENKDYFEIAANSKRTKQISRFLI